ncbi:hypothetical protein L6R49_23175 [Myxococcota bacterium]|nr:hypothetical protein [Myxococcota bacterium]
MTQAPDGLREAPLTLPGDSLALVELAPVASPEGYGRAKELAGGLTAAFELALTDLEGVVPRVGALAPSPGVSEAVLVDAERWTLTLDAEVERVGPERWGLTLRGTLCRRDGACTFPEAEGDPNQTGPAVAELMEQIALRLVRRRSSDAARAWAEPPSDDPYAVLLAGRAAATLYGQLDPPPPEQVGDKSKDPVTRAALVDPDLALTRWVAGRRAMARGEHSQAQQHFNAAARGRPASAVLLADEAIAWAALGRIDRAATLWGAVRNLVGDDQRFLLPQARVALALGQLDEAAERLAPLSFGYDRDPDLAALRVAIAEAGGAGEGYDLLLQSWEHAAPDDPEPTRRRLALRVRREDYEDALTLTAELARRGARDESERSQLALSAALGRFDEAATLAEGLGEDLTADRLRARAQPEARVESLRGDPSPYARLWRAEAMIQGGDAIGALTEIEAVLKERPWLPEALELKAIAQTALGQTAAAEATRAMWARASGV